MSKLEDALEMVRFIRFHFKPRNYKVKSITDEEVITWECFMADSFRKDDDKYQLWISDMCNDLKAKLGKSFELHEYEIDPQLKFDKTNTGLMKFFYPNIEMDANNTHTVEIKANKEMN